MTVDDARIRFKIGQPIRHHIYYYRGVVFSVDRRFRKSDEWYGQMTKQEPSRERPWYYVLVHATDTQAYVAEEQLEPDLSGEAFEHPAMEAIFKDYRNGIYIRRELA